MPKSSAFPDSSYMLEGLVSNYAKATIKESFLCTCLDFNFGSESDFESPLGTLGKVVDSCAHNRFNGGRELESRQGHRHAVGMRMGCDWALEAVRGGYVTLH